MHPRSANRRDTAVSPAKPRVTRSTRSQSRDHVDDRSSRAGSAESAGRRTRQKAKTDLPILEEDTAQVEYPQLPNAEGEEEALGSQDIASSIAGGPTSTHPESLYELEDFDGEELREALPFLHLSAEKLLDLFMVKNMDALVQLRDDLSTPGSKKVKTFNTRQETFQQYLKLFQPSKTLIDVGLVMRAMLNAKTWKEVGNGNWRADNVLHLANLAEIVSRLVVVDRESQAARNLLQILFFEFPCPFMTDLNEATRETGGSVLVRETLELGVEIVTQYIVSRMIDSRRSENFDVAEADGLSDGLFHLPENQGSLRGFPSDGSTESFNSSSLREADGSLPERYREYVQNRIDRMKSHWQGGSENFDIERFDDEFNWPQFLYRLCYWAQQRAHELKENMKAQGVESIQKYLEARLLGDAEVEIIDLFPAVELERQQDMQPNIRAPANLMSGPAMRATASRAQSMTALDRQRWINEQKRRVSNISAYHASTSIPDGGLQAPSVPVGYSSPSHSAQHVDFEAPPSAQPQNQTQEFMTQLREQDRQANKENVVTTSAPAPKRRFIDPQPGAQHITWGDSQPMLPPRAARNKRKQAQTQEESDKDNEDEGDFEQDTRTRKRRAIMPQGKAPSAAQRGSPRKTQATQHAETEISESPPRSNGGDEPDGAGDDVNDTDEAANQLREGLSSSNPALIQPSPSSRRRGRRDRGTTEHSEPGQRTHRRPTHTSPSQPHPHPPSQSPPPSTAHSSASRYAMVNGAANYHRSLHRSHSPKPQVRRAWTAEETERLIDLIAEHGLSWVRLKTFDECHEEGEVLGRRDQVALKDKARNMKMDFLEYVGP
ncbi:MAG: hypothetical protein Q9227_001695 [Pyrenula ochraceoflavens]